MLGRRSMTTGIEAVCGKAVVLPSNFSVKTNFGSEAKYERKPRGIKTVVRGGTKADGSVQAAGVFLRFGCRHNIFSFLFIF